MLSIYRPSEEEFMAQAHRALRARMSASAPGYPGADRNAQFRGPMEPPPEGFRKPLFGTPAYAAARKAGWISAEEERADRIAYEARRNRSLQTCHRYSLYERPRRRTQKETGAYVPELSAGLEADRKLTDGARRLARKLAEIIYRQNREGRFTEITVTYLMDALARSRRTIQRYLRLLEREGYTDSEVIRGQRSRLCTGLLIALRVPLFARHHRKEWPCKLRKSGASKESQNNRFLDSRKKGERLSVRQWSILCMDGVFRAFMKTDPLGLMEKSPPLRV